MNPDEYKNLAQVETRHWFYAGKREIVRHWIRRFSSIPTRRCARGLWCGHGIFAAEMIQECNVVAVDDLKIA